MWIQFLGTRGEIEEQSQRHSLHSGVVIGHQRDKLLVDVGEKQFLQGDYLGVLLTHYHPDHFAKSILEVPCKVYSTKEILSLIPKEVEFTPRYITIGKPFEIGDFKINSYGVYHSIKTPSVAYKITAGEYTILLSGDVISIANRDEALSGVDVYIGDGSFLEKDTVRRKDGEIFGHSSVYTQLKWCGKTNIPVAVFTHWGTEAVKMDELELEHKLKELAKEVASNTRTIVAKDGLKLDVGRLSQVETEGIEPTVIAKIEPVAGLILVSPHGRYVWEGRKSAMVKSKEYRKYINQPLWLISEGKVWGIVQYGQPKKITWEEFKQTYPRHLITEEEAEKWGWKGKDLYIYPLHLLKKFDTPVPCKYKLGAQVFVKEVKVLDNGRL